MFEASKTIDNVTTVDLYCDYPTCRINVDREQQRLKEHDVVIFMFPMYWYSTPSILKEWQDLVLEYGFSYGAEGNALHGKIFFCALTAGGPEEAYHEGGLNHFTIRELLRPLEQMSNLTGMQFLAPFALFGARTAVEELRVDEHISNWKKTLIALRDHKLDLALACDLPKLNHDLQQLIKD
ncbi:UNVERIFIED_CONTAM: hypothetical protein GTU68_060410 [Idotea baltica]|nr:hypothetical protein [Idotea baltica]